MFKLTPKLSVQADPFLRILLNRHYEADSLTKQKAHVDKSQPLKWQAAVATLALGNHATVSALHISQNVRLVVQKLNLGYCQGHVIRRQFRKPEQVSYLLAEHIQLTQARDDALVLFIKDQIVAQRPVQEVHGPIVVDIAVSMNAVRAAVTEATEQFA